MAWRITIFHSSVRPNSVAPSDARGRFRVKSAVLKSAIHFPVFPDSIPFPCPRHVSQVHKSEVEYYSTTCRRGQQQTASP